jgi:hypothetical protein
LKNAECEESSMRDMSDYGSELGVEARRILREALQALELHRANALIGDTTYCLPTDRVRRLASIAAAATVHEQRHALRCKRCHSRLRAFQGARIATPERALESALQTARSNATMIPFRWIAYGDQQGRALFDILRREREFGESPAAIWFPTHVVAQEIEAARNDGASADVAAYLVGASLGTVAAVTSDILSPWSRDFDRAWPMFELLREIAREVPIAGAPARDAFVRGYVNLAVGAPTHLKAILIDGIDSLGLGSSDGHSLASSLAAALRQADQSPMTTALLALPAILQVPVDEPEDIDELLRPYLIASRRASEQLRRAMEQDGSPDDLAELVNATLAAFFDLLSPDEDAIRTLLQLRVLRRYLSEIVSIARLLDADANEYVLKAVVSRLIGYARVLGSSRYLLMAASHAFAAEAMVYTATLSALAAEQDDEIRQAIIVVLRHAYDGDASTKRQHVVRFEQAGGAWNFVGATAHPLDRTARELAQSASAHPALAESFAWFNRRPEPSIDSEQVFVPMNQ